MTSVTRILATLTLVAFVTAAPAATLSDGNFSDQQVVAATSQLAEITGLAWAPDGGNRLFVTRKSGQVRIVKDGVLLATPFVDFSQAPHNPLYTGSECGVIGLCFDPDFASNHYVYFFVTVSNSEQRIYRYNAAGDIASDRTQLISGLPTNGANHDGGGISFGPDGKLYWAIGNLGNGSANGGAGATDLTFLASKVGRANRDGSPVTDNVGYNGGAVDNRDFIFARGFRNPFTLTFQPATGLLWVNVVGDGWEQVFQVASGDYVGDNTNENNQSGAMKHPVIAYATGGPPGIDIIAATRTANITTFTSASAHRLRPGGRIAVSGMGDASFNGSPLYVASIPTATTFTVSQNGPNGTSSVNSGSDAVAADYGSCISGGAFLDTTGVPAAYRGDFIFGDYTGGTLARARLSGATVLSVDTFATGSTSQIDVAVGPDGAIYYANHDGSNGIIRRIAYNHGSSQTLIVTPLTLILNEGNQAVVNVRLAAVPSGTVTVAAASGSGEVTLAGGATLTFTAANWNVPQAVTVSAAIDADSLVDAATITLTSAALAAVSVGVTVLDSSQEIVPSTASLLVAEGGSGTFTVRLSRAPSASVSVGVARSSGSTDLSVGSAATLTFTTANWATPQTVTINAASDPDTVDDVATISLTATGLATRGVSATADDTTPLAPDITSTADTTAVVGAPYSYDVEATGNPAPTYALTANPAGMTINATTGVISWTPAAIASPTVTVQASNGVGSPDLQSFTLVVAADQPPTATITQPANGATVSGTTAEFFGNGSDDVTCVRAEFAVDGVTIFNDINSGNHFHVGGAHQLWNTTTLSNGTHTLRMRVFDTAGQSGDAVVTVTVNNAGGGAGPGAVGGGNSGSSCGLGAAFAGLLLMLALGLRRLRLR